MPQVTGVNSSDVTASSANITWNPVDGAQSYVIRYGVDGQPNDRLHYSETSNFVINDEVFAGTLAGQTLNFFVQAFAKTYAGADEIEKANNAMKDNADIWSEGLQISFTDSEPIEPQSLQLDEDTPEKAVKKKRSAKKSDAK